MWVTLRDWLVSNPIGMTVSAVSPVFRIKGIFDAILNADYHAPYIFAVFEAGLHHATIRGLIYCICTTRRV